MGSIGFENFRMGIRSLKSSRFRTLLSTLGIVIGVGSLLAVLNLGDSLEEYSRAQIDRTTSLGIIEVTAKSSETVDGISIATRDPIQFAEADVESLQAALGPNTAVTLIHQSTSWIETSGGSARVPSIVVIASPGAVRVLPDRVNVGSFFTAEQVAIDPAVAVISDLAAKRLTGSSTDAIGRVIHVGQSAHRVVGVLAPVHEEHTARILIPRASPFAETQLRIQPTLPHLLARLERPETFIRSRETTVAWANNRFSSRSKMVSISNPTMRHQQVRQGMLIFKAVMGCIVGISLVVGGIGIMNVLLSSVTERTREIGIRRAIGARRRDVLQQFLSESLAICGVGGLAGLVLGWLASLGGMYFVRVITKTDVRTTSEISSILLAFGSAFAVGIVFGLYPAIRASRLSPTEAIRQE